MSGVAMGRFFVHSMAFMATAVDVPPAVPASPGGVPRADSPFHNQLRLLCLASGCEDPSALDTVMAEATQQQRPVVPALLDAGLVEETAFLQALARYLGIDWMDQELVSKLEGGRNRLPARIALRHHLLCLEDAEGTPPLLLTYDPLNMAARQAVSQALDGPARWVMAPRRRVLDGLRQIYGIGAETFEEILEGRDIEEALADIKQETTVLDEADDSEASVVKFVNQIIREALHEKATDIHIEPLEEDLRIRYRIDGMLHEVPVPQRIKLLQASVISRLKIMAHLDIAERRLPQDGRINLEMDGNPIDVRVATIPSVTGESVSLRLLNQQRFDFAKLGLARENEEKIRNLLAQPNGIILLTGPTGCGKSTSLYTFLSMLNTKERRIVTIEDPVENKLPGVIQIAVKPEINLTFAVGLRSILRGDPNVVMIGEMRDFETAEIAIRAALTGHLVFSTLHTNDAVGGITRLIDMGVEPFLVSSAVRAFIAQRLVRGVCPHCRVPGDYSQEYLRQIGFPLNQTGRIYKAVGCEKCRHTGYTGRMAIVEICLLSPSMQDLVAQNRPATVLRVKAMEEGMIPLRQDGWNRVLAGQTTIEEVLRVTAADSTEGLAEE